MGSKRSSAATDSTPACLPVKRPKTHHCPRIPHDKRPARDDEPVIPPSADSRLSLLKDLVRELMNDPDVRKADPTVLRAISTLDGAFGSSDGQPFPTSDPSQTRQTQSADRSPSGTDLNEYRTPVLPSILDKKLEDAVFTHPACGKNSDATYDRLEILGDAYIELIATRVVWEKFPGISSGRISQIRELLVKNETLAAFAQMYAFDRRVLVPANYSDQPKRWTKTKGDVFEAYVAAVILSHSVDGYYIAEQWLTELWLPRLDSLGHQRTELRSKEALAKKVMGKGIKLEYVEERPAVQHRGSGTQTFFIGVYMTGWGWAKRHLGSGQGSSKVAAGDEAARNALSDTSLISEIAAAKELATLGE